MSVSNLDIMTQSIPWSLVVLIKQASYRDSRGSGGFQIQLKLRITKGGLTLRLFFF